MDIRIDKDHFSKAYNDDENDEASADMMSLERQRLYFKSESLVCCPLSKILAAMANLKIMYEGRESIGIIKHDLEDTFSFIPKTR